MATNLQDPAVEKFNTMEVIYDIQNILWLFKRYICVCVCVPMSVVCIVIFLLEAKPVSRCMPKTEHLWLLTFSMTLRLMISQHRILRLCPGIWTWDKKKNAIFGEFKHRNGDWIRVPSSTHHRSIHYRA